MQADSLLLYCQAPSYAAGVCYVDKDADIVKFNMEKFQNKRKT
jgi:hypothetical protein